MEAISKWLGEKKGTKINILIPKRGDKVGLIDMVRKKCLRYAE